MVTVGGQYREARKRITGATTDTVAGAHLVEDTPTLCQVHGVSGLRRSRAGITIVAIAGACGRKDRHCSGDGENSP